MKMELCSTTRSISIESQPKNIVVVVVVVVVLVVVVVVHVVALVIDVCLKSGN